MDLLRLVLARQPMARLVSLPRLLWSPRFEAVWRSLRGIHTHRGKSLIQLATLAGDISPDSQIFAAAEDILNRTIFLRRPDMYGYFILIDQSKIDFWYALSSGIPEIQAHAILVAGQLGMDSRLRMMHTLGDSLSIPWTQSLRAEIGNLLPKSGNYPGIGKIYGAAQLPLPYDFSQKERQVVSYFNGFTRSILRGGDTTEYVPEISSILGALSDENAHLLDEDVIRFGYLYRQPNIHVFQIYVEAVVGIVYTKLKELATSGAITVAQIDLNHGPLQYLYDTQMILTEDVILRARRCLADKDIVGILLPEVVARYKVIAGYLVDDAVGADLRMATGNPGPGTQSMPVSIGETSIAGCKMFDPIWSIEIDQQYKVYSGLGRLARRVAFARGQSWMVKLIWGPTNVKVTVTSLKPEYRDRVLTETSTFSIYPTREDVRAYREAGYAEVDWSYATPLLEERTQEWQTIVQRLLQG